MKICILGRAASGKTVIKEQLTKRHGLHDVTTYTTRPMREGETAGKTYHFISDEEFQQKIEQGFFTEYKHLDTDKGRWFYGSRLTDLGDGDHVIILTPDGFREVKDKLNEDVLSIYIYANNTTIKKRLSKRGDDKEEADRRFRCDAIDFKGVENEVDKIVFNNSDSDLDDVVDRIMKIVEEFKEDC